MLTAATELGVLPSLHGSLRQDFPAAPLPMSDAQVRELYEILAKDLLYPVFQPVLNMQKRDYLGYEALIRGPQGSALHTPAALFAAADRCGLRIQLEKTCRKIAVIEFARQQLRGKLFVNLSANILSDPLVCSTGIGHILRDVGMRPDDIVIEITENTKVADFPAFRETLNKYRRHGYQFAIDDLGEGFSNLRMWSEIRPEFVKIDRHFISGIADDHLKFRLVRSMAEIAEACHATLIAEGIENEAEFATVRDLGISCGQGYFIARPQIAPDTKPDQQILRLLERHRISVFPQDKQAAGSATVSPLLKQVAPVSSDLDCETVLAYFERDITLHAIPVVDHDVAIGMINRHTLIESFCRPYRREIYGKRSCTSFMDKNPIIVDCNTPVQDVGNLFGQATRHQIYDGFIITERGRYIGTGDTRELMVQITEMQIKAARYANPLTQLPGNVPINEHMMRLLDSKVHFVACYADICDFKPFNDIYGYRRGDEIIQLLGTLLRQAHDERLDFIGHIGGDDFMLLMQSGDWQERCEKITREFDEHIRSLIDEEDLARGGLTGEDRHGKLTFHPLPSLAIGCLTVDPENYTSHIEVSAAVSDAKQQAKKHVGSSLFVERRLISHKK